MAFSDEYYRAYREFRNAVFTLPEYQKRLAALHDSDSCANIHNGSSRLCQIDLDWVEAIERALPSIDKAIRENRRFISVEDEIVPIEKSRRITTESVRHLAQHTSLISSVEEDTVTPERILNIRREESFAVYENRFLVLLLDTALRFVEKRFETMRMQLSRTFSHIVMKRGLDSREEKFNFTLDFAAEFNESTFFDINDDISEMTEFARVQRIRAILSAFSASPLIRGLKGVEPVRPPIAHTNVLQKDPDFHACLELWVFLERYTKDGFRIEQNEIDGVIEPLLQDNLEAAMDTVNFVVRYLSDENSIKALEKNYEEGNRLREEEAEQLEKERLKDIEERIQAAVASERIIQEENKRLIREEYEKEFVRIEADFDKEKKVLEDGYDIRLNEQREIWNEEKKDFMNRLDGEKEYSDILRKREAAVRKEKELLEKQLEKERRSWQKSEKAHKKELNRISAKCERIERDADLRIKKQEKYAQERINELEQKLKKANGRQY